MRRPRPRQRAAPEEHTAQVRATAARLGHDAPGRTLERRVLGVEHTRLDEHVEGVRVVAEVKLVAGLAAERVTLVGANLGLDAQRAQESEGAACDRVRGDVEVEGERTTTAQVHRAGGVEDRRGLGQPVAAPRRRDGGQLGADVLGERAVAQSSTPSSARRRRLSATPDGP